MKRMARIAVKKHHFILGNLKHLLACAPWGHSFLLLCSLPNWPGQSPVPSTLQLVLTSHLVFISHRKAFCSWVAHKHFYSQCPSLALPLKKRGNWGSGGTWIAHVIWLADGEARTSGSAPPGLVPVRVLLLGEFVVSSWDFVSQAAVISLPCQGFWV